MTKKKFDPHKFWDEAVEGVDYFLNEDDMRCDIKERDPRFKDIIRKAGEEAEEIVLKDSQPFFGMCHSVWDEQKRILKEKYNIDWKTPAEMNPLILFD